MSVEHAIRDKAKRYHEASQGGKMHHKNRDLDLHKNVISSLYPEPSIEYSVDQTNVIRKVKDEIGKLVNEKFEYLADIGILQEKLGT